MVNTSAARDGEASRDPSIAELISFRQQAGSPAKPGQATKETTNAPETSHTRSATPRPTARTGYASQREPAPSSPDLVHRRQLEKSVSWSGRERLQCPGYRLRLTVAEMNYATRRMVELQAPWISDDHPSH